MTVQIDHVVIAGSNLAQLRAAFESIGLTPDEGGVHADGQTHNALIGFADGSYLELIAPTPGNIAPNHAWSESMRMNAGVCAWAIRSSDIQADVVLYRSRGITVGDPTPGGRTRPDGVRLEWVTAKLGNEPLGSMLPFLIQDVTPREWRVPRTKSVEGLMKGVADILIEGNGFDLIEKAFAIQPNRYKAYPTQKGAYFLDLPINVTILADPNKIRVRGVVLDSLDFEAARKRYFTDAKILEWRAHFSVWPSMKHPALKLGIVGASSDNAL
jgi:hypothetical protein